MTPGDFMYVPNVFMYALNHHHHCDCITDLMPACNVDSENNFDNEKVQGLVIM